ncbi:MAG TPA: hypothetical protein VGI82_04555 [Chitinophagaceae bacterium]|jgi:hypothetical protein
MKYFLTLILGVALFTACKPKILSGAELQKKLIETMQSFLDKEPHPGVQFDVKDVTYYPEVAIKSYDCRFHVDMRSATKDTLGTMMAIITNDFKKIDRRY